MEEDKKELEAYEQDEQQLIAGKDEEEDQEGDEEEGQEEGQEKARELWTAAERGGGGRGSGSAA
eukprot:2570483-Rhodomonas_salina.1